MSQISVNNLTFSYEGSYDAIFEKVSFQMDTDWKLGFIGRNGRGKTTFLNLLMGKYEYTGSITSHVPFDYFPYQIPLKFQEGTTLETIEYMDPEYEFWKVCREFSLLKLDTELLCRPFGSLSSGERTKVMLAVLFSKENNFLLIDEPTNHLDMEARETLREYLNSKKGFLLVSHDRWLLDACIDHVLALNKANIQVEQGNFTSWFENKARQDRYELAENEKLKQDIKRLTESAKKTALWADKNEGSKIGFDPLKEDRNISTRAYIGSKTKKMEQRRKNLESRQQKSIEEKSKLLKNVESQEKLKIIPLSHYKEELIRIKDLAIYYDGKKITGELSFCVKNGDRIALQGKNGCGKSSVLKKFLGEDITTTGNLEMASGLIISYVSQDTSHLRGTLTEYAKQQGINETRFLTLLRKLDLERVQFEKHLEDYSEGQKKKVLIAKSLCQQAHLYIWDEPLNYIDVFSRIQIEELIKEFRPTMLFVEHDKFFIKDIATKIIEL